MSKNPIDRSNNQKDEDSTQGEEGTEGNKGQGQVVVQVVEEEEEEEEEEYFYESLDRIASSNSCSCSNSTTPSSDSDSDPVTLSSNARRPFPVPKFPMAVSKFDIWISEPASVSERRTRLLREMGLSRDPGLSRSRPGSETELGLGREMGAGDAGGRGVQLERRSVSSDRLVKKESEEQDRGVEKGSSSSGIVRSKSNGDCNELAVSSSPCLSVCPNSSSILSVGLSFVNNNNNTECDRINVAAPNLRTCESNGSTCNKPPTGRSSKSVNGELGSKSFDGADDAAGNEVDSSEQVCTIKNLDNGKEFVVKEIREDGMWNKLKEVGTGRQLTMEEFEMCVGHSPIVHELMRRQNVEEGNKDSADLDANGSGGGGDVSKFKKKGSWFKSIKSVASSVTVKGHKERRSSEERDTSSEKGGRRSSSATDDSQDVSFHGPERVRVKQYGKSCKELTALYKSQEIQAHNGSIWSIKFSLDGKYLASAGEDCEIHVWKVVASEKRGELMEKVDDGNLNFLLVANGSPETTMLSPIADHHPEKKRRGRSSLSRKSLSLDPIVVPDTVFALSDKPFCSFQGHSDDVLDLSWSKSQQLLSSSMDKTVRLWDLISKTCLRIFSHSDYVTCIQFNPVDDKYFISGSLDAKVRIWSIPDRKVVDWNDLHEMVTAACYTPDGQGALVGSYKGSCHLYDTSENKLQPKSQINLQNKKKKAHQKKITGFQFAPGSSSEVLITSADSRIRLVDESDLIHKFKGFRNTNSQISASVTTNGKYVVSASEDSYVYVWKQEAESRPSRNKGVTVTYSYEHFHCKDVSVAIPWPGICDTWGVRDTQLNDQNCFDDTIDEVSTANHPPTPDEEYSGNEGSLSASGCTNSPLHGTISSATNSYFFDRISATWPEEKLLLATRTRSPRISLDYTSGVNPNISAWGMVIVTAGLQGEIRTYQNFGLPVRI
ncbi:WD repeat-containing protein 44-like isoform X2 [Gossypium australe]|uniref:WD repeat-containing protein 44-like isoform X2 n=1 Tax=Gossypium australe TaxID=47621 RepID=A0A5B6VEP6_9ROSI|nr:WD repeat-containing protein 44-like isoform X2 [Gossypium australe]